MATKKSDLLAACEMAAAYEHALRMGDQQSWDAIEKIAAQNGWDRVEVLALFVRRFRDEAIRKARGQ